jgi:hypothetical protein
MTEIIETVETLEPTKKKKRTKKPNSKFYPKYEGDETLFVYALKELNISSSLANRKKIAKKNGINFYSGWKSQNIKLFDLLKEGKLIKP